MKKIFNSLFLLGAFVFVLPQQSCKDKPEPGPAGPTLNMYENLSASGDYSVMLSVIDKIGLKSTLNGTGNVTVLALSNNQLTADGIDLAGMSDSAAENFVNYLIIPKKMEPSDFVSQSYVTTKSASGPAGKKVSIYIEVTGEAVRFNGKNYTKKEAATNGVIYVLESSIKPPTVLEALAINLSVKTYRTAVNLEVPFKTGLETGPNTIFATSEAKFVEYLNTNNTTITSLTPTARRTILNNSIILGANKSDTELSATESTKGADLMVSSSGGTITLNGKATITKANGQCTNGVIHVISDLLN